MTYRVVRPKIIALNLILFGLPLPIPIFSLLASAPWYITLISAFIVYGSYGYIFHYCVVTRIVVKESGLEYHTLFSHRKRSWNEIKYIGIGYYPFRTKGVPLWIYFTEDVVSDGVFANSHAFLRVHYRKSIITEVSKYWTKEIAGLQLVNQ